MDYCSITCSHDMNPTIYNNHPHSIRTHSCDPNSVTGDSNCARCRPDTLASWKPTHEMIRRSVPIRTVKTRRRFGSKTASFYVSVRSCVFPHFPLSVCVYIYTYHFIWLSVIFYLFDCLYHFTRRQWAFTIFILLIWMFISVISCTNIDSGLVEVYLILWHLTPFTGTLAWL